MAITSKRVFSSKQGHNAWIISQLFKLSNRLYPLPTSADTHLAEVLTGYLR